MNIPILIERDMSASKIFQLFWNQVEQSENCLCKFSVRSYYVEGEKKIYLSEYIEMNIFSTHIC